MKKANRSNWLHAGVWRISRLHFIYVGILVAQILIYDAWKLIAPEAVLHRWIAAACLLTVTTVVWYTVRGKAKGLLACKLLLGSLILTDIAIAAFSVYAQRGMASRAVLLFIIPIIVSAVLMSRRALFATAALAAAAYSTSAIAYFVLNFNEGYKIELYGEVGFYCAMFFVTASLLWTIIRAKRSDTRSS